MKEPVIIHAIIVIEKDEAWTVVKRLIEDVLEKNGLVSWNSESAIQKRKVVKQK